MMKFFSRLVDSNEREVRRLEPMVAQINALEPTYSALSDDELMAKTAELRARLRDKGSGLDWDEVYFTINGEKLITEWEADHGAAWVRVPLALSPGTHRVGLHAADRAGNETTAESTFTLVR